MGNIFNNNRAVFNLRTSKSDYWDTHLNPSGKGEIHDGLQEECLAAYIDTTKDECITDYELISSSEYKWDMAVNNGVELNNIGLTGVDNGLIRFNKKTITDDAFLDLYTNSKLVLDADDYRLHVAKVNGNNNIYRYTTECVCEDCMRVVKLDGGFYQGFFKHNDGCDYQVLPNELGDGICLEFTLKPEVYKSEYEKRKEKYSVKQYNHDGWDYDYSKDIFGDQEYFDDGYVDESSLPTLNDMYPENLGIFFYIGTRAENKWWRYYVDPEDNTELETADGVTLNEKLNLVETDNKFFTYNRTEKGLKAIMGHIDDVEVIQMHENLVTDNYFLIMNRAKGGYTARTIKELQQKSEADYDILGDLYKNALAFQIKTDGSIGYKYLVRDCDEEMGYKIENEWSYPGIISIDEWVTVDVRLVPCVKYGITDYGYIRSQDFMRILIYVDGKIVLYSKMLPMIDLRMLNDISEKQEGVAYNISIGGGTQGLCDVIYEDYENTPEYILFLEREFGGSFIGYFKSFKFYSCNQDFTKILANVKFELSQINK